MNVKISTINHYQPSYNKSFTKPSFKGACPVETIKHYNLGMMPNGIVGKIRALKSDGKEVYLNLEKQATSSNEIYSILDDFKNVIGRIEIQLRKNVWYCKGDEPSHVFVKELRNYSNPRTPYYRNNLEEYKQIGVRLLQVAQRRSDEAQLEGNIMLVAKCESLPFYKKLGFVIAPSISRFINPNKLTLPPEAKEPLSKLYGGL